MKRLLISILLIVMLTGCKTVVTSPLNVTYTGEISERGLSITAKPPFWETAVIAWRNFKEWMN